MTFEEINEALRLARAEYGKEANGETFRKVLVDVYKKAITPVTILGMDVFQYSKKSTLGHFFIPHVLKYLRKRATDDCYNYETLFFKSAERKNFEKKIIDNGDGYFLVFDNPMQALVFAIHFEAQLRLVNAMAETSHPEFSMTLGEPLTIRYAMSTGQVVEYDGNSYGKSIIDCARIISRDKLNRFLMDKDSYDFFSLDLNGIETLQALAVEDFVKLTSSWCNQGGTTYLFANEAEPSRFKRVDVQQIEKISVKEDSFEIYSIHLQVQLEVADAVELEKLVISIGNLNSSGL